MHKLEITPAACLCCGMGNTPDNDGNRRQFVDLERDINWNDPAILCEDCIAAAGGLIGMASMDMLSTLKQEMRDKDKELHEMKVEVERMKKRARRIGVEFTGKTDKVAS